MLLPRATSQQKMFCKNILQTSMVHITASTHHFKKKKKAYPSLERKRHSLSCLHILSFLVFKNRQFVHTHTSTQGHMLVEAKSKHPILWSCSCFTGGCATHTNPHTPTHTSHTHTLSLCSLSVL